MKSPEIPIDEAQRLASLEALKILDSAPDPAFDQLAELAQSVFDAPMVLITIVGKDRQWFKSRIGIDTCSTTREVSFCGHVVADEQTLVIPDTHNDPRFSDNPLVTNPPHIRFYAGAPIHAPNGAILGTICLLDTQPRHFDQHTRSQLEQFARQTDHLVCLHQSRLAMVIDRKARQRILARYEAIFHEAAVGIVRINSQGLIQGANHFVMSLLGYNREELIGKNVSLIMPERWAKDHDHYIQRYQSGGQPRIIGTGRQVFALHKHGHEVPIHLAVAEVHYPGNEVSDFIGILSDLTELSAAQEREEQERALLRSVMDASEDPIFAQQNNGDYMLANRSSLELAGLTPQQVTDFDISAILDISNQNAANLANQRVIASGRPEKLRLSTRFGVHFDVTKSPVRDADGHTVGVVNVAHDVTDILEANKAIESQQKLLAVLHKGLTDYRTLMSGERFWAFLKKALRDITDSDYALIGEVLMRKGQPELKIHAITDLSWNEESRALMHGFAAGDMRLTNEQTMLGRSFAKGEVVISTDTPHDPRSSAFPHGHPTLHNYMGVPIIDEGRVIGMYAIANSRADLSDRLAAWLQPFTATCALMLRLYRQMAEREQIMDDLAKARDEQARASRAKTDFLSAMSHELRTPLNSIIGFSQLMRSSKRNPLPQRTRRQAEQIEKSGHHLLELINEVLELSQIESGKLHLSIEPVTIAEVLTAAMETAEGMAEMANIRFVSDQIEECRYTVKADYTRLKQVIINLLSNAIKYNRAEGRIFITCQKRHEDAIIAVRDEGFGIAENKQPELFEAFNRLGAENSAIQGTGVGLSLTKQLVEAMDGEIGFNSAPNQGTTFWVRLPRASDIAPNHLQEKIVDLPTAPIEPETDSAITVLYVEDNPANQRLMEDIFEDFKQANLHVAADADTGIMLAQHLNPDLILMDVHLPGTDGFTVLKALKADNTTKAIPVAAVSANALESDIKAGEDAGFVAYLTKPVNIDALSRLVEHYQHQDFCL